MAASIARLPSSLANVRGSAGALARAGRVSAKACARARSTSAFPAFAVPHCATASLSAFGSSRSAAGSMSDSSAWQRSFRGSSLAWSSARKVFERETMDASGLVTATCNARARRLDHRTPFCASAGQNFDEANSSAVGSVSLANSSALGASSSSSMAVPAGSLDASATSLAAPFAFEALVPCSAVLAFFAFLPEVSIDRFPPNRDSLRGGVELGWASSCASDLSGVRAPSAFFWPAGAAPENMALRSAHFGVASGFGLSSAAPAAASAGDEGSAPRAGVQTPMKSAFRSALLGTSFCCGFWTVWTVRTCPRPMGTVGAASDSWLSIHW
mmetsp:Transcript_41062/g.127967  ORF Transcript_41062/g.127967 Transcript_41062/m.127967 type:complete len:328 (-) Transcript_41062:1255-2238(-)